MILMQDRFGEMHYTSSISQHWLVYCLCGKSFVEKDIVNTFTIDEPYNCTCKECYDAYEAMDKSRRKDIRHYKGKEDCVVMTNYFEAKHGPGFEEERFDILDDRWWWKLIKLQNKIRRQ